MTSAAKPSFRTDPTYLIDTWETEDGLPENSATAMVQAADGYLWFGTFNGLVRFDGMKFTVFNPVNTPGLPSGGIVNLHLDGRGSLWVSTYRGLVVRDGVRWRAMGTNEGWTGDYVRTFAERPNGDVLLTSFDGKVFEFANGRLTMLPRPPSPLAEGYLGFADALGVWWVVQDRFVGSWNGKVWTAAELVTDLSFGINGAGAARGGGLWLLTGGELRNYRGGKEVSRTVLSKPVGNPWSITEDSRGIVWIASYDNGLSCVLPSGETRRWTTTNGLSYNGTRFVFEDREKNLWVGTSGGGLQRFKPRRFRTFGVEAGLADRNVTSIASDTSGGVWVATYNTGIYRCGLETITHVPLSPERNTLDVVNSVLTDRGGRTWFGTWGQGVCVSDSSGFRRIAADQTGGLNILSLFEDSRGRIWAGGESEVSRWESNTFRLVQDGPGRPISGVRCFAEDPDGVMWLSNLENVFRFEKDRFVEVRVSGMALRNFGCIKADTDGTVWLGGQEGALLCWSAGRFTWVVLDTGESAPAVSGILEDDTGFFWMASNRGVLRAARNDLLTAANGKLGRVACGVLDLTDGLPSIECASNRQPVCARDERGRLCFATLKGAAVVDPAEFRVNTNSPPVHIETLVYRAPNSRANRDGKAAGPSRPSNEMSWGSSVHGSGRDLKETRAIARDTPDAVEVRLTAPFSAPLRLPPGSRRVEIHYTAPSFTAPEKVRFQVRLAGADVEWQESGDRRVAHYHDLSPGHYVFQVRAANNDRIWNETGASLAFSVQPRVWQMPWFRTLLFVALAGSVYSAFRHRLSRLEKERASQQAFARQLILSQENERKRIAAELHDGLGQDLLLIKHRLALAAARLSEPSEHTKQLEAATAATNRAISEARAISHALRPVALEELGLTKAIEWMFEQLGEGSSTKFDADLDNIDGLLTPEMEMNLFRVIQESLNNVARHARAAQAILEVKHEQTGIRVSLFDDGCGFETEALRGLGLVSMGERVRYLGGSLELLSAPARGTRVTVRVPLPQTKG